GAPPTPGHRPIEYNDTGRGAGAEPLKRVYAVARPDDRVPRGLQGIDERAPEIRAVFDKEDGASRHSRASAARACLATFRRPPGPGRAAERESRAPWGAGVAPRRRRILPPTTTRTPGAQSAPKRNSTRATS